MINLLTIDLEDYYQVSAFESVVKRENWANYESRVERNTYRLLEILQEASSTTADALRHSTLDIRHPVPSTSHPEALDLSPDTLHLAPCASRVSCGVKATFFCLGWIAERFPHLIKEIHNQGHEIACHGYDHRLVYGMPPEEFRQDIRKSKKILEDIIGTEVTGYRAASYSITHKSLWAFQILAEEGYRYDSSIFPIHHDRYGIPNAPRFPFLVDLNGGSDPRFVPFSSHPEPCTLRRDPDASLLAPNTLHHGSDACTLHPALSTLCRDPDSLCLPPNTLGHGSAPCTLHPSPNTLGNGLVASIVNPQSTIRNPQSILELPISTIRLLGQNLPVSGGGYFRLLPYAILSRALNRINQQDEKPFTFYLHPWEIDSEQPKIRNGSLKCQFRHYINLEKTEDKLKKLLVDFRFCSIKDCLAQNGITTQ